MPLTCKSTPRASSQSSAGAWSLRSGTSQNGFAAGHAAAPLRSRLYTTPSSRSGSPHVLYQIASTSPDGSGISAGSWLWCPNGSRVLFSSTCT